VVTVFRFTNPILKVRKTPPAMSQATTKGKDTPSICPKKISKKSIFSKNPFILLNSSFIYTPYIILKGYVNIRKQNIEICKLYIEYIYLFIYINIYI